MDKELFAKLFNDESFKNFCDKVDELRKRGHKIDKTIETAALLFDAKVVHIKGYENIKIMHNLAKEFLNPAHRIISKITTFYDYFIITNIMQFANNKIKRIEDNRYRQIPLDFTEYANSIYEFNTCTCGYEPKIIFTGFANSLTGNVICEKCGLSVSKMFIYDKLFTQGSKDYGEVYVNLKEGIKELSDLWNKEVVKNESILHRTMRELLSYGSNVGVNPIVRDMHNKLYGYMVDHNIYRKPKYWNEPGYWDIATDKMIECVEPVKWVEEYLWENMPNRIGA